MIAAAQNDHDKCIELQIRVGAGVYKADGKLSNTALIQAARNGHDKCVGNVNTSRS